MADIFDTLDEVKTEQKRDIFDEIGDVAPEAHHVLPDPNVTTTVTPGPFNLPSPEQPSARVPIAVGPEAQDAILAERSKGPTTKQFVNEVIPEAIANTAGSVMGAVAKPFTHYAGSTLTKVTEKIPGVPFAKGVIANKFPGGKYAIGAIEGAQDIADSFLSPLGVATLGMGMLPKAGQKVLSLAFAVDMARNLPEQARQLKVAIDSGDQVAIAKAMVGLAGNATFSALAAKHGLSVDPSGKVSLQQGSDLTQAAAERAQQNIAPIENRIAIEKAAQDAAAGRSPEAGPDIMRDFGQPRAMVPAATIPETLLPMAAAEAAKQTKKAEVPNASSKQETATVHGDLLAPTGQGAGQVPVAQGQRRILAQAPGRVPEGGEAAAAGAQPKPHAVEPVVEAAKPPEVEGVRFDHGYSGAGGKKLWQFTVQDNGAAHNAGFSVPEGSTPEVIRTKIADLVKERTAPDPDWQVTVQAPKGEVPGYVQIVDPRQTEASQSPTVESLRGYGHEVPDFSKLPEGKYTWDEAVKKANELGKEPVAEPILKVGDAAKLMGFDTVLAKSETHGGVRYELFNGARLKDRRAVIRVTDVDSGKVVTLKQHGNYNAAEKEFNTSVKAAAKAAAPPPAPAFKRTKTTLESKVTDFIKGSIGLIRNKKYGKPGSEGDYGSAYKAAIERHGTGLFGKNGRPPNEVVDDLRRAGLLGENATVDDLWDVINAEYDTQTKHRQGLTPEAQADKFYEAVDKNLKRKDAQPVSIGEMGIGAKFKLNGQEFEITHIDPDTGEVTAKDGTKFGSQQIPDGADIPVDKGTFEPAKEVAFEPETKPAPKPELKPGEKQGDLISSTQKEDLSLAGEKGTDADRIAAANAKAEKDAAEAAALEKQQQGELGAQPKIFTNEEASAAAHRLLSKLGGKKSFVEEGGPDPGILRDLGTVIGNLAERGVIKFADMVAEMVKQFGEGVRPYLKPAYDQLRRDPKSEPFREQMSSPEEVGTISEPPEGGPPEPGKPEAPKPGGIPESGTGIQNAAVDAAKEARGEEPLFAPARLANQKVWDDAMARIDADPAWQDRLINELRDNPRTLTPEETIAMDQRYVTMQEKYAQTARELADAYDDPTKVEAIPELEARLAAQSDALLDFEKITQDVGTEWGRSGQIRQRLLKEDYTLARMTVLKRAANGGRPLTDAEMEEVGRLNEKIAGLQKQHDEYVQKHEERMSELQAQHAIEMLKREAAPVDPVIKRIVDRIGAILKEQGDAAMQRLRVRMGRTNTLSPQILADYAIVGATKLFGGALEFGKWSASMISDFGESIKPHLDNIFKAANEHFDAMIDQAAGKRAPAVRKAAKTDSPKEKIEAAKESIREKVKTSDQPDISRAVQKLARSLVEDGVSDMHALIDEVHKFLQEIDPEITRREAMDAISGYGKYKQLSKDEVSTQLRDLKGQMQQVAKLLDLFERRPPQKTGMERRTPTDEERRWLQQVNEAKKRFGVQSGDSAGQLKSALASLKTRLRNQIADFEAQIAAKTKTVRERAPVPEDPESVALKAQRDKLKGEFDEMFGKPELTDEQRVEMALKSLERQSAEIERQIKQGDIFPSGRKSKTPSTPEIEAAKAKRDALKAEREYLRDAIRQEVPETDSEIAAKALEQQKKSLEKQIGDLEKRIASGDTGTRGAQVNRPAVPEIEALKQQRDALSAQIAEARKKPAEQKAAEAMQKRLDAMNKAIADREARIAAGDTSAVGGPGQVNRPLAPKLEQAKQRLEAVNARLAEMRKNARPRLSADAIALKSAKTRMANQIATLQDKLARRDFAPRTRRTPPADAETNRLSYELQKAKREFHEALMKDRLARRSKTKKILAGVGETLNTARAIQTSIDLSAVLRQGGFITLGHPIRAAKVIPDMLRAMVSPEAQHRINEEINNRPNAPLYRSSKLYLSDQIGKLSQMEEAYMTRWAEKIPGVAASQRAYTTFLNRLRADSFDAMAAGLGRGETLTPVEAKAIANYINKATGRGSFGGNDTANVVLNTTFFSPRYLASRLQLVAGQPFYGGNARTRIAIAKEYARFLAGVGVVYALGSMAGGKIEDDPRSSDFGKMRFGNSRVDPLTGLSQISTLAGRVISGQTKTPQGKIVQIRDSGNKKVPYGGSTTFDVMTRFGRSKLSPSFGAAIDIATGRDFAGQKVTAASEAGKMLTPISVQDIYQAMQSEGVPEGTIIGLLSIFGMGVQTYDEKKKLPK